MSQARRRLTDACLDTIELASLDGRLGFAIKGIDADDLSGFAVSSASDVNNDGFDDVIIGADSADPNGSGSGHSDVILGASTIGSASLIELSTLDGSNGSAISDVGGPPRDRRSRGRQPYPG